MRVITKPITAKLPQSILTRILKFIRTGILKYFLFTLLIVFIIQTIRQQSLFTIGTFILGLVIFLFFLLVGLGLMMLSVFFFKLAAQKEFLQVEMTDQGLAIKSQYQQSYQKPPKIIPWQNVKQVSLVENYYCFLFDAQRQTGFSLNQDHLSAEEKQVMQNWLKTKSGLDVRLSGDSLN